MTRLAAIAGFVALAATEAPKGPSVLPDAGHSCFVFNSNDDDSLPYCVDIMRVQLTPDAGHGHPWRTVWLTSDGGRVECRSGRVPCDKVDDRQLYDMTTPPP
ncbi:MAG: hypothetical protein JST54_07905 [Deltaproteobacteria bacterium]|nr:hypothetical protein [Deltaproteobacteria bacterium]